MKIGHELSRFYERRIGEVVGGLTAVTILGGSLMGMIGFLDWVEAGTTKGIKSQAIERGYAQYCADTGKWAWKNECNESAD